MTEERQLTDADRVFLALNGADLTIAQLLQHPDLADLTLGRVLRAVRELLAGGEVVGLEGTYHRTT